MAQEKTNVLLGDTIRIIRLNDEIHTDGDEKLYEGKEGKVVFIGDRGVLYGSWGGAVGVVPNIDEFEIVSRDCKKKLYVNFEVVVDCETTDSSSTILEKARKTLIENNLAEVVNENNTTIVNAEDKSPFVSKRVHGRKLIGALEKFVSWYSTHVSPLIQSIFMDDKIKEIIEENYGTLIVRRFATEKELEAYQQGLADQLAFQDSKPGEFFDCITEEIWDEAEANLN